MASGDLTRDFVRFIASQYGKSMHIHHLRLAAVLFLTSINSDPARGNEAHQILIRRDRLIKSIKFRLNQPDNLDESDLFCGFPVYASSCPLLLQRIDDCHGILLCNYAIFITALGVESFALGVRRFSVT